MIYEKNKVFEFFFASQSTLKKKFHTRHKVSTMKIVSEKILAILTVSNSEKRNKMLSLLSDDEKMVKKFQKS